MSIDSQSIYVQLGRLMAEIPNLFESNLLPVQQWLGKAYALLERQGDIMECAEFKSAVDALRNRSTSPVAVHRIQMIMHRALAKAELSAPIAAQGAFITTGAEFDAFAAVGKILSIASHDILIVDPYMDEKVLTVFAALAPEKVEIRLLTDQKACKPTLKPAINAWVAQYGITRPLQARVAAARSLHDRLIVVDAQDAWILTQSLNAFAARAPATIVKVDTETSTLKIPAYETMWQAATPI